MFIRYELSIHVATTVRSDSVAVAVPKFMADAESARVHVPSTISSTSAGDSIR